MGTPDSNLREVAALLADATRCLELAKKKLNTKRKKCGDCCVEKYVDLSQGRAADELGGMLAKLRRFHSKWVGATQVAPGDWETVNRLLDERADVEAIEMARGLLVDFDYAVKLPGYGETLVRLHPILEQHGIRIAHQK